MCSFRFGIPIALASAFCFLPPRCMADEVIPPRVSGNGIDQSEMSREEWRQRVEEAKRRVKEDVRNRREHPELYAPVREDSERIASERVLSDDTLQKGDIVATKKGLFLFRGDPDKPRSGDDFVPLSPR